MTTGRRAAATLAMVAALAPTVPASAQTVPADLLERTTGYVREFIRQFSNVVAEERYVQEAQLPAAPTGSGFQQAFVQPPPERRVLQSDFLLVRRTESSDWVAFRDVYAVDGREVRNRQERLVRLFLQQPEAALQQARRLEIESARFNLRPSRATNNPLVAIGFLQPRYRDRFEFTLREVDRKAGPGVVVLQYREKVHPTIFRRPDGGDLAAEGRYWVERDTGRVVRTEVVTLGSDSVTTDFAADAEFKIDVPVEMREAYPAGRAQVTGVAKYGRFRRFAVKTDQDLRLK